MTPLKSQLWRQFKQCKSCWDTLQYFGTCVLVLIGAKDYFRIMRFSENFDWYSSIGVIDRDQCPKCLLFLQIKQKSSKHPWKSMHPRSRNKCVNIWYLIFIFDIFEINRVGSRNFLFLALQYVTSGGNKEKRSKFAFPIVLAIVLDIVLSASQSCYPKLCAYARPVWLGIIKLPKVERMPYLVL